MQWGYPVASSLTVLVFMVLMFRLCLHKHKIVAPVLIDYKHAQQLKIDLTSIVEKFIIFSWLVQESLKVEKNNPSHVLQVGYRNLIVRVSKPWLKLFCHKGGFLYPTWIFIIESYNLLCLPFLKA